LNDFNGSASPLAEEERIEVRDSDSTAERENPHHALSLVKGERKR
jgi:hypothetical protein